MEYHNSDMQNNLERILDIIYSHTSQQNRNFQSIISVLQRLMHTGGIDFMPTSAPSENDSLEKVSYYIDLALNTFQNIGEPLLDNQQQLKFLFALSETYETLGNYEAALKNYQSALRLAVAFNNRELQGQIQYRIGHIKYEQGFWIEAKEHLKEAILALRSIGNQDGVALAQIELAKIAYRKGDYIQAKAFFEEALLLSETSSNLRNSAIVSNHLAVIYRMQGDYSSAFSYLQKALIEFQSIQDRRGSVECLNNIGLVHLRQGEFQLAVNYFDKAQQSARELGNFPLLAFVYLNKADFYNLVGDYPMAITTCARALEILVRLKNPVGIARTNALLGHIFKNMDELNTADAFYRESIRLYDEFSIPLGLANSYKYLARLKEKLKQPAEALKYYNLAKDIYQNLQLQKPATEVEERIAAVNSNGNRSNIDKSIKEYSIDTDE